MELSPPAIIRAFDIVLPSSFLPGMFPGVYGAAAAPTPVQVSDASNVQSSASTTHTATLPGSLVSGNLLLVFGSVSDGTVTTPAGWTKLFGESNASSERYDSFCFYKVSNGAEGASLSITVSTNTRGAYSAWQISGAGTPEEAHTEFTSATTLSPPSLSPSGGAKNYLWIAALPCARPQTNTAIPSGYTAKHSVNGTVNNNGHSQCITCYKALNAASEDAGDFTFSAATGGACAIVAVPPA